MSQIPGIVLHLLLLIARIDSALTPPAVEADLYQDGLLTGIVRLHRPIRPTDRTYRLSVESSEFEPFSLTIEQSETVSHFYLVHATGDDEPRVLDLAQLLSQLPAVLSWRSAEIEVATEAGVAVARFARRPYGLVVSVPDEGVLLIVSRGDQ
ncbi:MAG: hypothetical protein EA382_03605 [Spirochaetaceae bacterium]|nr:MAG: hypothetical protein EA382_03605 [Spirochaetaceae bacterium]